jgi:hypothetical protein
MTDVDSPEKTKLRGFKQAKAHKELKRDFILVTADEAAEVNRVQRQL